MPLLNPSEDTQPTPSTPKRKAPYATKQRIKDEMTPAQKNGVAQWNIMIDILKENGLMEEREK